MATSAAQFPLPLAPEGAVQIGDATFVHTDEHGGQVWLLGRLWWSWQTGDEAGRRLAAVQLAESGIARRIDIAQAFRITPETLWRWRQTYAREGIAGLAPSKPGPKGAWKLTDEVISHIVALHAEGHTQDHIASGEPLKVVQERLGHHSLAFTQGTYQHLLPGMGEAAARRFEELLLADEEHGS